MVNFVLFSSNNSLAEINVIVVLYNVCGFVLNMYILFMSGFSGERKREKKGRRGEWNGRREEWEKREERQEKEGKGKKRVKREYSPYFLRLLPICGPFEQETLTFKPWGQCAGRRGMKGRRIDASKRQRDSEGRGCSCFADVPFAARSTWWLPRMRFISELCPAHTSSKWLCLAHREMHVLLVTTLQQRRRIFGNLALLKCLLNRRGSEN